MLLGIGPCDSATQHRDRSSARFYRADGTHRINAERHSADDHDVGRRKLIGRSVRRFLTVITHISRSYHTDAKPRVKIRKLTEHIQKHGRVLNILELFRIPLDSVRNDISNAELFVSVILGIDDPVFNIDSLMDNEYVEKEFNRAGFKEFSDNYDQTWGRVTVQAIEGIFKGNTIKIRRYYK